MAITAQMVKELRESTGAGMMDCKKALQEAEGNMERAVDILREKGLSKAAKKADRIAAEGLVADRAASCGQSMCRAWTRAEDRPPPVSANVASVGPNSGPSAESAAVRS